MISHYDLDPLKRVWRDPVWSKVIAAVIMFVGGSMLITIFHWLLQLNLVYVVGSILCLLSLLIGVLIGVWIAPHNRLVRELQEKNLELSREAESVAGTRDENQRLTESNRVLGHEVQELRTENDQLRIENKRLTENDSHSMENRVLGCVTGKSMALYQILREMDAELPGPQKNAVMAAIGALQRQGLIIQDMHGPAGYLRAKDQIPF